MIKELSSKIIYEDFINKTFLTEDEKIVLDMFIIKESVVKIGQEINMSERNVSRIIKTLKKKYDNYKKIQIAMLDIFLS